jgi:asparagine synthase (glutamine-hydrolysing)
VGTIAVVLGHAGPPDPEAARAALAASPHRGTVVAEASVGTAVLAIARGAEADDAWLAAEDGSAAVFSGTVDNAAELARELGTETLDPAALTIAAFHAWGPEAPSRFRGIFAGALATREAVTLFRDQFGFRTLFYRDGADALVAATEAKQVAAGAGIARRPDEDALADIFYNRLLNGTTALRGVARFPRASVATTRRGGRTSPRRYWDPAGLLESARMNVDEAVEAVEAATALAVERCVTGSDAVALSGGLDSPVVAALAAPVHRERGGGRLLALSAVYPQQPAVDERPYIELVAEHLDLELHTYEPEARPLDDVAFWVDRLDGPVDTLPLAEVAESYRLARAVGARTVLTGEIAEWLLTIRHHLLGHLLLRARLRPAARLACRRRRRLGWRGLAREVAPSLAPAPLAGLAARRRRDHRLLPPWVDPGQVGGLGYRPDLALPARRRWREAQVEPLRASPLTLEADDLCAAAFGAHGRKPFADVDLWELCLCLPAETKFPDEVVKGLLRRAMADRLPERIVWRPDKTSFNDHYLAVAEYDALGRWLVAGDYHLEGVDYGLLGERLERREMNVVELGWANDLARVHAFAGLWA